MELRQLRYFSALAEHLNYSRAAKMLYITQPTLSQQIGALEKDLGVMLFERGKQNIRLTPAGEKLKKLAADLIARADQTKYLVQTASGADLLDKTLRVGYSVYYSNSALAGYLRLFKNKYPQASISVRNIDTENSEKELFSQVDIIFTYRNKYVPLPMFDSLTLSRHRSVLLVPPSYMAEHPNADYSDCLRDLDLCIVENDPRGMRNMMVMFERLSAFPRIQYVDTTQTALLLVEAGLGVTVANNANQANPVKYRTVELADPVRGQMAPELEFICIWNQDSMSETLRCFLDILESTL